MNVMKHGWCQKMEKRELAWFLNYSAVTWQFPPRSAPNHMPTYKYDDDVGCDDDDGGDDGDDDDDGGDADEDYCRLAVNF